MDYDKDYDKLIADAHDLNERHGTDIKGKKYSSVALRIELFRKYFGAEAGISTEVLEFSAEQGKPVVVRAIIADKSGMVLATGTSFEIVGAGYINKTAALENAETSAVGRALAMLGIHGGEIASANEMPPTFDVKAAADRITGMIQKADSVARLEEIWRDEKQVLEEIKAANNGSFTNIIALMKDRKENFVKGQDQ